MCNDRPHELEHHLSVRINNMVRIEIFRNIDTEIFQFGQGHTHIVHLLKARNGGKSKGSHQCLERRLRDDFGHSSEFATIS